jgi:hypothetical protein
MPVRIKFANDGIGVVLYHEGVVTGEELINAISNVYNDERYLKLKYWIGDRTGCTEFLPDANCLKKIAGINKKESIRNPGILLALVAPKDLEFGMSRMFQVFAEKTAFRTEVFRDKDTAEEWIRHCIEKA